VKNIMLMLVVLLVGAGCNVQDAVTEDPQNKEFTDTGCNRVKADVEGEEVSLLTLKYQNGDLLVTRTNAIMNCSINNGGIVCEVSFAGSDIYYKVYEKDGPTLKCLCPVDKMSSKISGLQPGKQYTFHYSCAQEEFAPITFPFEKSLNIILDAATLVEK